MASHLEIHPEELEFKRPFTCEVSRVLRLRNTHVIIPLYFKVKTTAPKQYCVRPNSGRIEAGGFLDVQVLLQAMREDPPLDQKCRDKFLVQFLWVDGEDATASVADIWERAIKSIIHERKIRVIHLPPDSSRPASRPVSTPARQVNGTSFDGTPSATSPPMPAFTPSQSHEPPNTTREGVAECSTSNSTSAVPSVKAAAADVVPAAPITNSEWELKKQLIDAQAMIEKLEARLVQQHNMLRQRKAVEGGEKDVSAEIEQKIQQPSGGLSARVTAMLCFLSFLVAYLFF